jgi:hypothetical protein
MSEREQHDNPRDVFPRAVAFERVLARSDRLALTGTGVSGTAVTDCDRMPASDSLLPVTTDGFRAGRLRILTRVPESHR